MAQTVKRLSTMWETWVQSLGGEDPLEKEMAPHSSTLGWKIPWTEERGRLQSMGSQRVGHDWATSVSVSFTEKHLHLLMYPTSNFSPVLLRMGESWLVLDTIRLFMDHTFIGRWDLKRNCQQGKNNGWAQSSSHLVPLTFWADNFLLWGTVLCTIESLRAFLVSIH